MPTFTETESVWRWVVALVDLLVIYLLYWGGMTVGMIPMIQGWYVWLGICYIVVFVIYPPMAHLPLAKAAKIATHALWSSLLLFALYVLAICGICLFCGQCWHYCYSQVVWLDEPLCEVSVRMESATGACCLSAPDITYATCTMN